MNPNVAISIKESLESIASSLIQLNTNIAGVGNQRTLYNELRTISDELKKIREQELTMYDPDSKKIKKN